MRVLTLPATQHRGASPPSPRRRAFGLESPLPADRLVILRSVLRHLAEARPGVVPLQLCEDGAAETAVADLMLLAPGGRSLFVKIKPQAETLSRTHRAFADLCRACGVPLLVLRSLPEARQAFDRLKL